MSKKSCNRKLMRIRRIVGRKGKKSRRSKRGRKRGRKRR